MTVEGLVSAFLGPVIAGEGSAYSYVEVFDLTQDQTILNLWDCEGYGCPNAGDDDIAFIAGLFTQPVDIQGGDLIEITLQASVNPVDPYLPGTTANALADPYFQIDPSYLNANPGVSLEFSPGINNVPVSSTPEPSCVGLAGIAIACAFGRRRFSNRTRA